MMRKLLAPLLILFLAFPSFAQEYPLGATVNIPHFFTFSPATGGPKAPDAGGPARCDVYRNNSDTPLAISGVATAMSVATTNSFKFQIAVTAGNGFAVNDNVNVDCGAVVEGLYGNTSRYTFRVMATENTAGYMVTTIKDGTGVGEIDTTGGAVATTANATELAIKTKTDAITLTTAGQVDANVFQMQANTVTAAAIAAGAIGPSEAPNLDAAISSRLAPTVAARTLNIAAGGQAGVNWGDVANPTTTVGLSGTTIGTVTTTTTATNLTNAPTNGDLTATMKTSVTTAATAATPTAAAVTGTVGGITAPGWAGAFTTNTTKVYSDAVGGSIVKEIADNAATSASQVIVTGTSDSGSTTTMVDAARTEADNDYWKGDLLCFTSGNISGQCRIIEGFVAATDTITFAPATTQAVATQNYSIYRSSSSWDSLIASHLGAGSTGAALNTATAAGDPNTAACPGAYSAGTVGDRICSLPEVTAGTAGGVFIAGTNAATTITTGLTTHFIGTIDALTTYTGNTPQTGDSFARLGAPATTTISADIAAVKSDTTAINTRALDIQNRLPAALTGAGNMKSDILALNGGVQSAVDLKDFADDGYDPALNKVEGVKLADTITTYTGNTPQTGDSFARIGPTGSGLTSLETAATGAAIQAAVIPAVAGILTKVTPLPADPADQSLIMAEIDTRGTHSVKKATAFKWGMKFVDVNGNPVTSGTPVCTRALDQVTTFLPTTAAPSAVNAGGRSLIQFSAADMTGDEFMWVNCTLTGSVGYEYIFKIEQP